VLISNFPVALDACVLYPRALRDTLLRAAERSLYTPYWSVAILDELKRNLVADRRLTVDRSDYLVSQMTLAFPSAAVAGFETLIPCMTNHEKDRHVAAAAVRARAEVIVTSNLRDFPEDALSHMGSPRRHPTSFYSTLRASRGVR
jgi:predicted nucleic acid-binding protein